MRTRVSTAFTPDTTTLVVPSWRDTLPSTHTTRLRNGRR